DGPESVASARVAATRREPSATRIRSMGRVSRSSRGRVLRAGVRVARRPGAGDPVPAAFAGGRAREAGRAEVVAVGEERPEPGDLAQEGRAVGLAGVDLGDD